MKAQKGMFCLEGLWYGDLRDKTSVLPVLELLERHMNVPFHYHRCATSEEFEYSLSRWKTKSFHVKYPILYLAFHGKKGILEVGKKKYNLQDLADILGDSCKGVVIHFGSCETVNIDERIIKRFLENTGSVAAFGYKKEVDWMMSAAFEILLLEALQSDKFDSKGIEKIKTRINTEYGNLHKLLDFRIIINDKTHF